MGVLVRGSSDKTKTKISSKKSREKRHFKKRDPQEQTSGLGVTVHGDDINKGY